MILLEKASKAGVKILVSGGTRCNVANRADRSETLTLFGHAARFLKPAFHTLFRDEILELLKSEGVPTKLEETGKYFPCSDRALDIQQALVGRALRAGVELRTRSAVRMIEPGTPLGVRTDDDFISADKVILCCGGRSYPKVGTTGDGYRLAQQLGHSITPTHPGLAPLAVPARWLQALSGITLPSVTLQLRLGDRKIAERKGDLLLTHFGLSGPVAMNLSSDLARHPEADGLALDLAPTIQSDSLRQTLLESPGKQQVRTQLGMLPSRLAAALLHHCEIPAERKAAELAKRERQRLITAIKQLALPLNGTLGFDKAEVTTGGVALSEVNPKTMASRVCPGLYLAGEVLDIDGPIGGFNFQAAFSTGYLAGESAT